MTKKEETPDFKRKESTNKNEAKEEIHSPLPAKDSFEND